MTDNWVLDEESKTITHKHTGLKFGWCITAGQAVLAPFPHPATNDGASYVLLLREAKEAGTRKATSPENREAFRSALQQQS
jgi:hypothetical protein